MVPVTLAVNESCVVGATTATLGTTFTATATATPPVIGPAPLHAACSMITNGKNLQHRIA
jgi:hypothetical protein